MTCSRGGDFDDYGFWDVMATYCGGNERRCVEWGDSIL